MSAENHAAEPTNTVAAIAARIATLRHTIEAANDAYYNRSEPLISDGEYDGLLRELQQLEAAEPELVTDDSPTQRVGAPLADTLTTRRHPRPMLSLANARDNDELAAWEKRAHTILPSAAFRYICELKIDGLAMALTYEQGQLTIGATRGNGIEGEDVTANVRVVHDIPHQLQGKTIPERVEVRGEIYMPIPSFEQLNAAISDEAASKLDRNGAPVSPRLFANPRNAASGSLQMKDAEATRGRNLHFFAYQIGYVAGNGEPTSQEEALAWLRDWGFAVNPHVQSFDTLAAVNDYCQHWMQHRFELPYEIDGCVVKINSRDQQDELGVVARDPRWAIAYKFPPIQATTVLRDININVGRTGTLNPQALLDPVVIGGVTVKQASLHNEDDIRRKDLRIGDTVLVQRAGDVIPHVIKPILEKRPYDADGNALLPIFSMPTACPSCGAPIRRDPEEAMAYCTNPIERCPAQLQEWMQHFVSSGAMDIMGIGAKVCRALLTVGLVHDPADLYTLTAQDLEQLEGFKQQRVTNTLASIAASKAQPLPRLLFALGIRHVGEKAAHIIANHCGTMAAVLAASEEDIAALPGIGPIIGASVYQWIIVADHQALIARLAAAGVRMTADAPDVAIIAGPLSGQSFLLTGRLEQMTRTQAEDAIRQLGGTIASGVSKTLSHLIAGADAGSKLAKAQKAKIPVHDETWLINLLHHDDTASDIAVVDDTALPNGADSL